jgi:hypothetical protein
LSARPYPSGVPYRPPAQRQSSLGGYPQVASAYPYFATSSAPRGLPVASQGIPSDGTLRHQDELSSLPERFTDQGWGWQMNNPADHPRGSEFPAPGFRPPTIVSADPGFVPGGGFGGLPVAPANGLLPGEIPLFHGQPVSGGELAGVNTGPIGSRVGSVVPTGGQPVAGVTFGDMPAPVTGGFGAAELLPAGTPPAGTAGTGGMPYATDPLRHFAGYTNIGNGVVQTPAARPSFGAQVARFAAPAAAGMVGGPVFGALAQVIANSASRGSFDNAQPYRGAIQDTGTSTGRYAPAGTTYWGTPQYYTGSSYSNSPFTPSGSGWQAPSFTQGSGGSLYATNPETHQYTDSQGRIHSY